MIDVACWRSPYERVPVRRTWSLGSLERALSRPRVCESKDDAPLWSPTRYRDGASRGNAGVEAVTCAVLDYDDGATDPAEAAAAWAGWWCLAHTTWRHRHDQPRFRLVLPLARPVPVDRWRRAWAWVVARAEGGVDRACCDAARLYYLPAVPRPVESVADAARKGVPWWWGRWRGRLLDVPDDLPPTDEERAHEEARRRAAELAREARGGRYERAAELRHDANARRALGVALGGTVGGVGPSEAVRRVTCPACGRASVWWPVVPRTTPQGMCQHRESCGWMGWLDTLEAR